MISEHAIIHSTATVADDVTIGPWTIIGENVKIGHGTKIASHVVIDKNTLVGEHNTIYSHVVLGSQPQHLTFQDTEETWLEIGNHNVIREFVTMNRGTSATGTTQIGDHNYLMSYAHVAHDCRIGNHVIFANTASIAGHVTVGDHAILGAFSGVHQFVHIGEYCFLGRATKVVQDILPYMLATGNPGSPRGLNSIGLRRHGFDSQTMLLLKEAYAIIFRRGLKREAIILALNQLAQSESAHVINPLIHAIKNSERGIARADLTVDSDSHHSEAF